LKILIITGFFPPRKYGGVTTISYLVAKKLRTKGHEVIIFTTDVGNSPCSRLKVRKVEIIDGVQVYYFKNLSNLLAFKHHILLPLEIFSALKCIINYDIVHFNEFRNLYDVLIGSYAERHNIPYIVQIHGSLPRVGTKRILQYFYDILFGYRFLRHASGVIALSDFEKMQYEHIGVPSDKINIIPNGIDLSEYVPLPPKGMFKQKFGIPENKKLILFLGRVHKSKGIDLLIKAYAYLVKRIGCEDAFLVIAGPDDGYLGVAKSLVNYLGISKSVLFTGFISKEDKIRALVDSEVFVTPTFYGFPITFLEACVAGTPIVSTNLGDSLEWINNNTGYITQPKPDMLAKAIYKIITNEDLRRRFSQNCLKMINTEFSIEKTVSKLEEFYEKILKVK
jgi:glycosyltransferase involved in cell wall biosynthesis